MGLKENPEKPKRTPRGGVMEWLAPRRAGLDVVISLVGIVSIALAGLTLEDLLPVAGRPQFFLWRIVLLLVFLVLLMVMVWVRGKLRLGHGTLYFIRYLEEWMPDWHLDSEQAQGKASLDVRVVSRTLDQVPVDGVLDVADDVTGIGRDLQMTMNDDDASTGFQIAPNVLWAASISLGYDLYGEWPSLKLVELGIDPFTMALRGPKPTDNSGLSVRTIQTEGSAHKGAKTVLVSADLTARRPDGTCGVSPPRQWEWDVWYRLAVFETEDAAATARKEEPDAVRPVLVRDRTDPERADHVAVRPEVAVSRCVEALRDALHQNHGSTVLFAATLPKAVALAIGWRLRNGYEYPEEEEPAFVGCRDEACQHPWRYLVPLHYDQGNHSFVLARVHRSQPEPAELVGRLTPRDGEATESVRGSVLDVLMGLVAAARTRRRPNPTE